MPNFIDVGPTTRPPTACGLNEATCMNGECVAKHEVCDGDQDCSDGSDEVRCGSGKEAKNSHGTQLSRDIPDKGCEPNEYQCSNRRCVFKSWVCDGDDDCGDGSDEVTCGELYSLSLVTIIAMWQVTTPTSFHFEVLHSS